MMLVAFLSGAITMGFGIAALFFLRFWRVTGEGLFAAFAVAFLLFGIAQALLAMSHQSVEGRSWIYLVRLAGFLLILFAVVRKNLGAR